MKRSASMTQMILTAITMTFVSLGCSFLSLFGKTEVAEMPSPVAAATKTMTIIKPEERLAVVEVENLNFRSGPSPEYTIIAVMHKGDVVKILNIHQMSSEEIWARVSYNGTIGYCNYDFIFNDDE